MTHNVSETISSPTLLMQCTVMMNALCMRAGTKNASAIQKCWARIFDLLVTADMSLCAASQTVLKSWREGCWIIVLCPQKRDVSELCGLAKLNHVNHNSATTRSEFLVDQSTETKRLVHQLVPVTGMVYAVFAT